MGLSGPAFYPGLEMIVIGGISLLFAILSYRPVLGVIKKRALAIFASLILGGIAFTILWWIIVVL